MYQTDIKLDTIDDVKDFVSIVTGFKCDFEIRADRFIVDAKSIMGIFSLDLSKNITLVICSNDDDEIESVLQHIDMFIAKAK